MSRGCRLRPRLPGSSSLPPVEVRLALSTKYGYSSHGPARQDDLKKGIPWPRGHSIPASLGVAVKTMAELRRAPMQEQQAFHRAATARFRLLLGMGWAVDGDTGTWTAPLSTRIAAEYAASGSDMMGEPVAIKPSSPSVGMHRRPRIAEHRLGSRASRLKQALILAKLLLDGPSPSSKAEPSAAPRRARCVLYTRLVSAFCGAGYPRVGLDLLRWQAAEELEVEPRDVSMVLKGLVAQEASDGAGMEVLEHIMPLLPDDLDAVLLTQVIRVMIATTGGGPDEVKSLIDRCWQSRRARTGDGTLNGGETGIRRSTQHRGSGMTAGSDTSATHATPEPTLADTAMADWEWGFWDVYLSSFAGTAGWRRAMVVLGEFCSVVQAAKTLRSDTAWTEDELDLISRPFVTVMTLFTETTVASRDARLARRHSNVPQNLVDDYLMLGSGSAGRGLGNLTVPLVNSWMNAERVVGNHDKAEKLWEMISGAGVDGQVADSAQAAHSLGLDTGATGGHGRPAPDSLTYQALFKLLAQTCRSPSPTILHRFLMDRKTIATTSLNAALSTILHVDLHEIDESTDDARERLVLAWMCLRAFDNLRQHQTYAADMALPDHEWRPNERTVDIVSAGLVKLWRAGLPVLPEDKRHVIPTSPAERQAQRQARDGVKRTITSAGRASAFGEIGTGEDGLPLWVSASEWDLISDALHELRFGWGGAKSSREKSTGLQATGLSPSAEEKRIDLPLRRPVARVHEEPLDASGTESATGPGSDSKHEAVGVHVADPSAGLVKAQTMIKPLMRLIGTSLRALMQRSTPADASEKTGVVAPQDAASYGRQMQEEIWWLERRMRNVRPGGGVAEGSVEAAQQ